MNANKWNFRQLKTIINFIYLHTFFTTDKTFSEKNSNNQNPSSGMSHQKLIDKLIVNDLT